MTYKEKYNLWLNSPHFDKNTKAELQDIKDNPKEIEDRFYTDLTFGTGGLRGIIGAGTNRMNIYTVRKASQGIANYILKTGDKAKDMGVVVAHDSRKFSKEFAIETALVFAKNGIKSYIFDDLRPTPLLSFSVLQLGCIAGVMITASHNPKEYNGYKAYWASGGQITHPQDNEIIEEINKITDFATLGSINYNEAQQAGLVTTLDNKIDDLYLQNVLSVSQADNKTLEAAKQLKVVYSPLNGAGNVLVCKALASAGFTNVHVVKEQEQPDPSFATAPYPNPEEPSTFELAINLAKKIDADIIITTDPDCDRMGVMTKASDNSYKLLSGNQVGAVFTKYILENLKIKGKLKDNAAVISTIVSSGMTKQIAKSYNTAYYEVLTGFKYIGEKITSWEKTGKQAFVFGFEESIGYLAGTYARDKDGVLAAFLICEIAAYYKSLDMTLLDGLDEIYNEYGYFKEATHSITLKGIEGRAAIAKIMSNLRNSPPKSINDTMVLQFSDYKTSFITNPNTNEKQAIKLPMSDVLHFKLENNFWFCVRPSGTEPKIKIYFGVMADTSSLAKTELDNLSSSVIQIVEDIYSE